MSGTYFNKGGQVAVTALLEGRTTTGAGDAKDSFAGWKTFQASGATSADAGSATVVVQGSMDGTNWNTLGTITLTLGTASTSDGFTSSDRYRQVRGNVTAISGTGAVVSLVAGY